MNKISCITFDLDNTLWDVHPVIIKAEKTMREWLIDSEPQLGPLFAADHSVKVRDEIIAQTPGIVSDLSELRVQVLSKLIAQCGHDATAARELAEQGFELFMDGRHQVNYYPDTMEVLSELSGRYMLGALTNGNADINRLAIGEFFTFGHSSASIGVSKPDPKMFEAALDSANCAAGQAVHIGDHLRDDIAGAASIGMHTVWADFHNEEAAADEVVPSLTINSLAELPAALAKL